MRSASPTCAPPPVAAAAAAGGESLAAFLAAPHTRFDYQPAFVLAVALAAGELRLELELGGLQGPLMKEGATTFQLLEAKSSEKGEALGPALLGCSGYPRAER